MLKQQCKNAFYFWSFKIGTALFQIEKVIMNS